MEGWFREDRFHRVYFDHQDALMISRLLGYVTRRLADGISGKLVESRFVLEGGRADKH
jgi:hypothetical protein